MKGLPQRFWRKVECTLDGCWNWTGATNAGRYGKFNVDRKAVGSHRVMWQVRYGPIPKGMHVCHHCDNPSCVRPGHLFLGTASDNARDSAQKGRRALQRNPQRSSFSRILFRGEDHGMARLNWGSVRAIRQRYAGGEMQKALAQEFGVTQAHISSITRHKTWKERQENALS